MSPNSAPAHLSSAIVCLGRRDAPRARLVCLPHGGGGSQAFQTWPAALPDWLEVVAFHPPGRGARLREPAIDDMERLLDALLPALEPYLDLPFVLFGHSVGGLVAFAAAQRLEQLGLPPLQVVISGHAEPDVASNAEPMAEASDEALMASIAALGLLPPEVLRTPGLAEVLLPPVRADFRIAERYRPSKEARLAAPLTVLGGTDDAIVAVTDLDAWRRRTSGDFQVRTFPGGHFFTETARTDMLAAITSATEKALVALAPSVLLGAAEDYPLDSCLHELFRRQARRTPDAPALDGLDRKLDFAALDAESDLLARALIARGCGVDRMVAILMETSVDFVVAYLAILKAGGAYLPIPPVTPDRGIADILASVEPVAIVTRPSMMDRLPEQWRGRDRCVAISVGGAGQLEASALPSLSDVMQQPGPTSLAYCVMTSGTTGKPKGIICPHQGAVNSYWWRYLHLPYGAGEREACNVFFVWEVLRPLLQGRPAYIIPDDVIFDPRRLVQYLEDHGITRVLFTPSLFEQVLNTCGEGLALRLRALRMVILNGEVVSVSLAQRARALLPHVVLVNDYSISECHDVTTSRIGEGKPSPGARTLPAGRVMGNVRVYVLDDDLRPVPWGVPGEVYVAGPTLARGYLDLPGETAARFLPDPIQGGDVRMFRTGDIGRALPDGQLEIRGRARFMVKLRGYSVVPSAVEAAITSHPAIGAAVVTTVDDPVTGQPDSLAAYVTGRDGEPTAADVANLRAHLKERLPAYAIPAHVVPLAALPIQATTGKVDRKRLPPPPCGETTSEHVATNPGKPALEAGMRDVWAKVLGRAPDNPDDNFFDLGGHSLLGIRLALEAEKRFGVRLDVVDVFNHPTFSAYCRHVGDRMAPPAPATAGRGAGRTRDHTGGPADIAVVGMSCRFPGAASPDDLWQKLIGGIECVRTLTADELTAGGIPQRLIRDPAYIRRGALLDDVALFDARFFGLSEREATLMDPQQRLFIMCCHEALERAGHAADARTMTTGVWGGCYLPSYLVHHLGARRHLDPADPTTFHIAETGNDKDYLASRAAFLMGLEGPAISVQTSCSTGLVAIAEAAAALQAGRCDMALAGAASITFPQGGYFFVDGHIGSKSGHCRTFDASADGTILGDGVGVVVLRRLEDALADGDQVLTVIKGFAVNNDGATKAGYSAPSGHGQSRAIAAALDMAGIDAGSIGYVEAHGTATVVGDPIEVRALTDTYRRHTDALASCVLGSVKANLGHSNIAAGVAGFMKAVLTLQHKRFAPQINYQTPNPELRLEESPFRIATTAADWDHGSGPRRAAVSSFGIGGTNAHMVLEEAPPKRLPASNVLPPRSEVIPLSAKNEAALAAAAQRIAAHLAEADDNDLPAIAATLQVGRQAHACRRAVVATSCRSAAQAFEAARARVPGSRIGAPACSQRRDGGVVLVFPGQGSQHPAMGAGLMRDCAAFASRFKEAAALFRDHGLAIDALHDPTSSTALLATAPGLQASLFATEWALAETLIGFGLKPRALAGHSLGQIVAATVSGMLDLEDAVRLVAVRAEAMQAAPPGAMLALTATLNEARALIAANSGVVVAAINGARDIVVAGADADIGRVEAEAAKSRIATQRLAVTRAFHSPLMREAAARVADAAAGLRMRQPRVPVACNVSGGWMNADAIRDAGSYWSRHILAPVNFAANAAAVAALSPALAIEAGPGRSLSRLMTEAAQAAGAETTIIPAMRHARDVTTPDHDALARCVAEAWEAGCDIDWHAYRDDRPVRRVVLPTYPFELRRYWPQRDIALTPEAEAAQGEQKLPWPERFHVPSLRRASRPRGEGSGPRQSWLLLAGPTAAPEFEAALTQRLQGLGHLVSTADAKSGEGALVEVFGRLAEADAEPRIVYLCPLLDPQDVAAATVPLFSLVSALARRTEARPTRLYVLAQGGMATPGAPARGAVAALLGPLLSLGQEDPTITARLIDVDWPVTRDSAERVLDGIVGEITAGEARPEAQVALRGGVRWVERFDPLRLDEAQRTAGRRRLMAGPHIITGGLGRIGLALAGHLAGLGADVVLLTRKPMPPRDSWPALVEAAAADDPQGLRLRALLAADQGSGRVSVATADVTDAEAVREVIADTRRRFGRLGGIFHAAGLAKLVDIADSTPASVAAELAPKTAGTHAIAAALGDLGGADFVMLFSSLAATLGGLGLGAYAAANRYLDAFVDVAPVRNGTPWISIGWDDWDFDYGDAQQAAYARTRDGLAIAPDEGFAAIEAILGEPDLHRVIVSATALAPRLARWVTRQTPAGATASATPATPSDDTTAAATTPDLSPGQARVHAAYTKVLGATAPGLDDNFFDLGGDSLLATQIVLELSRTNTGGARLRVTDVFDFPTIRALAAHLTVSAQPPSRDSARKIAE